MERLLSDCYKQGARKLIAATGYRHPAIEEVLILHHCLVENLDNTLIYGERPLFREGRKQLLHQCDAVSRDLLHVSFAELCNLPESVVAQASVTQRDPTEETESLQHLIAHMSAMRDMLLKGGLLFAEEDSPLRRVAQERTLTILQLLDGPQRGELIRFLYGTDLIFRSSVIVSLRGANLQDAYLEGAPLTWVDLAHVDLRGGNLAWADLTWANLEGANLAGANLLAADLRKAQLQGANLEGANLLLTELTYAEYDEATLWPAGFNPETTGAIKHRRTS